MSIQIQIRDKVAVNLTPEEIIVCGNSGYVVEFSFDDEWSAEAVKTARFVYRKNGKNYYEDVPFSGSSLKAPVLSDINYVLVGVYAGNLITTTPAVITCEKSILCGSGKHEEFTPDLYNALMDEFDRKLAGKADAGYGYGETLGYVSYDGTDESEFDKKLDAIFAEMPNYTAKQIRIMAPNILGNSHFVGTLFRPASASYGVFRGQSYFATRAHLVSKIKYGDEGWLPFEWEDPSMIVGNEYRTTERFNYKPVYAATYCVDVEEAGELNAVLAQELGSLYTVIRQHSFFVADNLTATLTGDPYVYCRRAGGANLTYGLHFKYTATDGYVGGKIYVQVWYTK